MALENSQRIVQMRDTKANIEAATGTLEEAAFAYATDTGQIGIYTGGAWVWLTGLTNEAIDDRIAALLQAGANITLTYNDGANTLTIAAAGGTTGKYRQWLYAAGGGDLQILTDADGNPLVGLCDLE